MPRVLVMTDDKRQTVVDELVQPEHLDTPHSSVQLLERLAWGIEDAVRAEAALRDAIRPRKHREVAAS